MRKIKISEIGFFFAMLGVCIMLAVGTTHLLVREPYFGRFYSIVYTGCLFVSVYAWAILSYRVLLWIRPLPQGWLEPGSRDEFFSQVNAMYYLILFNSFVRTEFLPIPLKTLLYASLGSRIGANSYSPGTLLDPPLTQIGDNSIIGHGATVYAHVIEGARFALYRVVLGNNVTVGAGAVIMPDVEIGDGSVISAGAVVTKGTRIGPNEFWGGVPARHLGVVGGEKSQ